MGGSFALRDIVSEPGIVTTSHLSVVVHQFHLIGVTGPPDKTQSPLVVDADTVLALPITGEGLQSIARRHPKIVQVPSIVEDHEFLLRSSLDSRRGHPAAVRNGLGVLVTIALDHGIT